MLETPGWAILKERIDSKVKYLEKQAEAIQEDVLELLEGGTSIESIQTRSLALKQEANGLKEVQKIINQILKEKEGAENRIRES
jgi:hypothetical protein